jgi:hypothetical protein
MGGMEPDNTKEPRLKNTTPMPTLSASETAKNRQERMQDITSELGQWLRGEGQDTENIQSAENVTSEIFSMLLHKNSKLPVLFLQDPLGVALDNAVAHLQGYDELTALMKTISEKPFYQSAVLAYRLFFDPKTAFEKQEQRPIPSYDPETAYKRQEYRSMHSTMDWDVGPPETETIFDKKTIFGKCGDATDKGKLIDLLEVVKRQKLRVKIRELKEVQVDFLQSRHNDQPISRPDFIDVNTAMADYFSCEGYRYFESWQSIIGITANLDVDPCAIDGSLLLSTEQDRPVYEEDRGCRYLETLLEPSHPLHAMLFPTEQQAPVESDGPVQKTDPHNDGMGDFRPAAFAAAVRGNIKTPGLASQEARRLAQLAEQSVHDFLARFSKQWKQNLSWETSFDIKALIRLSKVASDDLVGMRLFTEINGVPKNYRIVDAGINKWRTLKAFESGKKALNKARKGPNTFKILNGADELIATDNLTNLAKFKGVPTTSGWSLNDLNKMQSGDLKIPKGIKVYSQSTHIIAVPESSPLVTKLNDIDAQVSKAVEIEATALRVLRKSLPPVVVLFEIWNLQSVVAGAGKSMGRQAAERISAATDLIYATLEGLTSMLGKNHRISKKILESSFKLGSKEMISLAAFGSVTAFASAGLSVLDMVDQLGENDNDAAVGHGIAAAGFSLMGFALLGKARIALFAIFSPWLWAATGLVLLGVIIANACNDTSLEEWAANGPFAIDEGDEKFNYLRDAQNDHLAYNALANCLFTPRIEIKRLMAPVFNESQKGDIRVTVHLPSFKEEKDEIDVRTYCEQADTISCITTKVETWAPRIPVKPFIVKQLDTDGQVTAIQYYYHIPDFSFDTPCRWATKARLFLADGPTMLPDPGYPQFEHTAALPGPPLQSCHETETTVGTEQDADYNPKDPGWVYTQLD